MMKQTMRASSGRKHSALGTFLCYLFLALMGIVLILPLWFIFAASVSGDAEGNTWAFAEGYEMLRPYVSHFTLKNYYDALISTPDFIRLFWNSVIISVPTVFGQTLFSCMAGYGFAKFKFRGKNVLFALFVLMMLMPCVVTLVPNYLTVKFFSLEKSYFSVILPGVFAGFGVFLMRQYIAGIPDAISEAARVDGAGELKIFFRMILPNCKGGIAALAILTFIDVWNQIELPTVVLTNDQLMPLSVYLSELSGGFGGIGYACAVIFALPVVLIFFGGEDHLVEGIEYSVL